MNSTSVVKLTSTRLGCQNCGLANICLSRDDKSAVLTDDKIIRHNHQFERGQHIFRFNDEFKTVYAIRSGSVKTYTSIDTGQEQVTGFHLPGELLGLDSISTNYHTESAVALESCIICEIPYTRLEHLSHGNPALQKALLFSLSEEIQHDHQQLTLVSRMSAESRLATFLISISMNFKKRGLSATDFNLSMTRTDIANLLGLAVETISRLFSQFQAKGILLVERRHIVIRDINGLVDLAHYTEKQTSYTKQGKAS